MEMEKILWGGQGWRGGCLKEGSIGGVRGGEGWWMGGALTSTDF